SEEYRQTLRRTARRTAVARLRHERHGFSSEETGDHPMAAIKSYADIVEGVLDVYTKIPYAHGDLTCEAIFDRSRDRFVLITLGWQDDERVHHALVHIDIFN